MLKSLFSLIKKTELICDKVATNLRHCKDKCDEHVVSIANSQRLLSIHRRECQQADKLLREQKDKMETLTRYEEELKGNLALHDGILARANSILFGENIESREMLSKLSPLYIMSIDLSEKLDQFVIRCPYEETVTLQKDNEQLSIQLHKNMSILRNKKSVKKHKKRKKDRDYVRRRGKAKIPQPTFVRFNKRR